MKLGLSTYSLTRAIKSGEMTVIQALEWMKTYGADHVEIVPHSFNLVESPSLISEIKEKAQEIDLEISNYATMASFIDLNEEAYQKEIERVIQHVEIANNLGVTRMRHDVGFRKIGETSLSQFEEDLPRIVSACQQIANYAQQFGIITSLENHGYYVQASDRVQRVVQLVDRPNFKTTLDIGNFLCVDENPVAAVEKSLPYASMVHFKDFYLRPKKENPGEGWFPTSGGNYLRGAIFGHGDIDVRTILKTIKQSGYDGYISLEFEGLEDCLRGSQLSLDNARRIWDEV
jgi:sugar phosphate isomerase/epimerase